MNPVNFPNVGPAMPPAAIPPGARPPPQVPGAQRAQNTNILMANIAQLLQKQGPYTGWRAEVPVRDRAVKIYQL